MKKVLAINKFTGIDNRSAVGTIDHPLVNMDRAPNIAELCDVFFKEGIPLSVTAARKALHEARLSPCDITHVVSTTCTNSANPGFDHYVCKQLGIPNNVEKVLLHGVGCSGGLAAIRTAASLALGASFRRRKARILVVACEICSTFVRSELESVEELQETRIGVTLFSDCASACVISNGIGGEDNTVPIYELLAWDHQIIPDTETDLGFDVHPLGWKVLLSPRVPSLTAPAVAPMFRSLLSTVSDLPSNYALPADFDWALHPGGATILTGIEKVMAITPEHMRASYDTYINHGNSSSATIMSVMDRLRCKDMDELAPADASGTKRAREYVVGCAFGPGISVEMCLLKRNLSHVKREWFNGLSGEVTPPETESEGSRSEGEGAVIESAKEKLEDLAETMDAVELD
ncbi:thiolase-like protein [Xylogone sp. PMI_703]|nr:thiolase-like protein [Xylogone sp. PMI_703]